MSNTNFDPSTLTLDDLYSVQTESPSAPAPQAQAEAQTPEAQPPAPPNYAIRTSTGTVYEASDWERFADTVQRGTEEKDRQIEQQRQWAIAMTGYDPVTGKPARATPYTYTGEVNYAQEPERYFRDLGEANDKQDGRAYAAIQMKWMQDAFLGPYGPVLSQAAKSSALENAERHRPGIREFVSTPKYQEYLNTVPLLKDAITAAETRPELGVQLQDLFVLAYDGASGRSTADILKSAKAQAQPVANPVQTPRPTLQPVMQPAGAPAGDSPDMSTPEGRQAIINAAKSRGLDKQLGNMIWGKN